ncbi:hypothetical protein [Petrotoga sp. 9PW.55.5.1]|uniref:hypothetical protein n=1 Tax=Petrotoga sp. 9PW.55.5.1 TaxID=1308979 RepID=UPI000DDBD6AF|nr:hypothetical protein [Petrotoga sp. 9PW.55.5.1]
MTIMEQKQMYVEGDDSNSFRIRIKKYIMNFGRYYEIRNIPKELRPKVPYELYYLKIPKDLNILHILLLIVRNSPTKVLFELSYGNYFLFFNKFSFFTIFPFS